MNNKIEKQFPLVNLLLKNLLIIVLVAILCALLGLGYSIMRIKPVYTATKSVMIRTTLSADNSSSALSNQAALSKIYLGTISNIIRGDEIIESADKIYKEQNEIPETDKKKYVNSGSVGMIYSSQSLIFKLTYTDTSADLASLKLDAFISAVSSKVGGFVQAENVYIIETQKESDIAETKFYTKYTVIGLFAGVAISTLTVFLIYFLDNTIKRRDEMESITGAAVVAYIEKEADKPKKSKKKK
ncbi:MAG: hypothetical protein J6U92_00225 [Clostridia bacterium]|nr:hypothetical protein [Clostridia bacterium]